MLRTPTLLLLGSLLLSTTDSASPALGPQGSEAGLETALAAVDPAALAAEVAWLADDARAGRDTPSAGLEASAVWLAEHCLALGLEPAGEPDASGAVGWRDPFPLVSQGLDLEQSYLRARSTDGEHELTFAFGEDYFLRGRPEFAGTPVSGALVSVGAGNSSDFEAVDVSGRWVLLHDRGRSLRRAQRHAEEAGAVGAIAVPGADYDKPPYAKRFERLTRALASRALSYPEDEPAEAQAGGDESDDGDGDGTRPFPTLYLTSAALARLVELGAPAWEGAAPPAGTELPVVLDECRVPVTETVLPVNIAGLLRGTDPELRREVIVLSAHYDHVGARNGDVYNGADDNASGTAGLLGLARVLVTLGPRPRSVLFLWVAAEEDGLWGSRAWAENPPLPEGWRAVLNVNLDMIGRTPPRELHLTPSREHEAFQFWAERVYALAPLEGFDEPLNDDEYWNASDHYSFHEVLSIPVVYLSSGDHDDYHKPTDTVDKIDAGKIGRIARLVARLVVEAADAPAGAFPVAALEVDAAAEGDDGQDERL